MKRTDGDIKMVTLFEKDEDGKIILESDATDDLMGRNTEGNYQQPSQEPFSALQTNASM